MIKHTELRCGNLVNLKYDGKIMTGKVTSVNADHIEMDVISDHYVFSRSNPADVDSLPLSEEWLIRAGAESSVFDNRKQYFLRKFGRLIIYQDGQFHEYATRVKLPFVHTLQNFIFVISDGEELTFKDIDQ